MSKKTGGLWAFIKRLFGFGKDDAPQLSFPIVADEIVDREMIESYEYDEEKAHRQAEEMIANSIEDEKDRPDDPDVFFQRATGYSILGENEKALEILDKILSIDAGYIEAYRLKASIYEDAEDFEAIVNSLSRAIALYSADSDESEKADDYEKRGSAYFYSNDFAAAVEDFTRAIEIVPDDGYLYAARGEAFYELGNFEKALADLNKSIEIDPNEYGFEKRAKIYKELGDLDAALRDYSKSIALNEENAAESSQYFDGYFYRAEIYMERGDYNSAVQDLTAQIERDAMFIDAYEKRAAAYRALGMDSLAEADEQKAAELSAEYPEDSI